MSFECRNEQNQALIMYTGIHNEPGIRKVSPLPSTEKVVDELLTAITSTEDEERSFVPFKSELSKSSFFVVC